MKPESQQTELQRTQKQAMALENKKKNHKCLSICFVIYLDQITVPSSEFKRSDNG